MIVIGQQVFTSVIAVDFEYISRPGERPDPVCMVARELLTGHTDRLWANDLRQRREPPYPLGANVLVVTYFAPAELTCHLALGWALPVMVLDLFTEFRNLTNGLAVCAGNGLIGALVHLGLDSLDATHKVAMRDLVLRGGPWTPDERRQILRYCEGDVRAVERLFRRLLPHLDGERALLRGRSMRAVASMEHTGIPIDQHAHRILRGHWDVVRDRLVADVDRGFGVYDGRHFRYGPFERLLDAHGIAWPRLDSGRLALDDRTFGRIARQHPLLRPLHDVRRTLGRMRRYALAVGRDGRNRCLLSPFGSQTGRNQPSSTQFIFGLPAWLRHLVRPAPGYALAQLDWEQEEFGIAAALSGDAAMQAAYTSGDPYLAFAKQAGGIPDDATKDTHGTTRAQFKACALAVQYGMGARALAEQLDVDVTTTETLIAQHHNTYGTFWGWSDAAVDRAMLYGSISTVFGWQLHVGADPNPRSLRNFPMQANGAEMLRLACCRLTESGIQVCAPIHDALLIEAPVEVLDDAIATTQAEMARASADVLGGFELRSDVTVVRHPDRFDDARGRAMWETVWRLIGIDPDAHHLDHGCASAPQPAHRRAPVQSPIGDLEDRGQA